MPFFKQIENEYGILNIWKLTEKPNELLNLLKLLPNDEKRFAAIKPEKRKTEFLATRILLERLFNDRPEIAYTDLGKPFLNNRKENISISHSADFAAIFCSEKKIGVDVEQENRNVEKIYSRFLHQEESTFLHTIPNQQRGKIVYWSAKEAIFKCSDKHGILFNTHIRIDPFDHEKEETFTAKVIIGDKITVYRLHTLFFENNVLVYCVEL